jgi:hypothetical protein
MGMREVVPHFKKLAMESRIYYSALCGAEVGIITALHE